MGGLELLAVIVFFLIGYWLVDFLWPKKKPPGATREDAGAVPADKDGHSSDSSGR